MKSKLILLFCLAFLNVSSLSARELGLNIYGLSYHFDRQTKNGTDFNELNFGLGLDYPFANIKKFGFSFEAGLYKDSLRNIARYAGFNVEYHIIRRSVQLRVMLAAYRSDSVSDDLIYPLIPGLTFRHKRLSFNFVYLPEFPGINVYDSLGLYLTFHMLDS